MYWQPLKRRTCKSCECGFRRFHGLWSFDGGAMFDMMANLEVKKQVLVHQDGSSEPLLKTHDRWQEFIYIKGTRRTPRFLSPHGRLPASLWGWWNGSNDEHHFNTIEVVWLPLNFKTTGSLFFCRNNSLGRFRSVHWQNGSLFWCCIVADFHICTAFVVAPYVTDGGRRGEYNRTPFVCKSPTKSPWFLRVQYSR